MTSKEDDTLPLPGFSQELSVDATIDEDFIPTSQPHSAGSSRTSRNSETLYNKSTEDLKCSVPTSDSRIDDTLPPEAVMNQSALDKDKSTDFIPDTETKKHTITFANGDPSCRKKLPVFGTEDLFKVQGTNPLWDAETSKIPESPALDTQNISILNDTPTVILPSNREGTVEESITEIVVNDSAETVDLEATPVKLKTCQKLEMSNVGEKCEETQIFDNSSVLLLDQPNGSEAASAEVTSEKLYLQETVEDADSNDRKTNGFDVKYSPTFAAVAAADDDVDIADEKLGNAVGQLVSKEDVQSNATEPNNHSIITRKIEFKLTVSSFVTLNTKTNKILQKIILNVNETPKPKPKTVYVEPPSDNSEKSKRFSSSSSGSVYSDKMGPFALPKRISAISDQTDSSEEDFGMLPKKANRALERVPWSNEYLLPLKMDDILQASVESQEFLKRPNLPSPKKFKSKLCNGINHLTEILESSSSEQVPEPVRTSPVEKETPESSEAIPPADDQPEGSTIPNEVAEEKETNVPEMNVPEVNVPEVERKPEREEVESPVGLRDGLAVFARWTDKRYYSGVLSGSLKNDRWDVKFDDGTLKTVREDFVMPAEWIKQGALVFASVDDKYESGQVVDVRGGEEVQYVIELDTGKQKITAKLSDLCLTDVMAGIVREKYKPLSGTPRGKADIDFDNVLSGKRLREQRTPLRPVVPAQTGSSGTKKKSSSKSKKTRSAVKSPKEDTGKKIVGLKSENGHLVEDKVISADSPSGTEAAETPLRKSAKEARKKAKPRSLSYEAEETRSGKKKGKSWLAPDGTPIPGPSGVKFKKQKTKPEAKASNASPKSTEKSKRKRKLEESIDEGEKKKSLKEEDSRMRTRNMRR